MLTEEIRKEIAGLHSFVQGLSKFSKKGFGRALADAIILEPYIAGFGFNFNKMIDFFSKK